MEGILKGNSEGKSYNGCVIIIVGGIRLIQWLNRSTKPH